jgi:hypothetical protein
MNKRFRKDFAVYCCRHIFLKERPVLLVIRDPDGDWQFLCGGGDDPDECHHVGVGHLLERDPSLEVMANLSVAAGAERRGVGSKWIYFELED